MRSLFALLIILSACTPNLSHDCEGSARDHVMLVDRLRCAGIHVEIGERTTLSFIRPPGTQLLLSSGGIDGQADLQSFNYDDTDLGTDGSAVSAVDAQKFASDGSLRDSSQQIFYRGTPHLYRADRVLVIYTGDDPVVIAALTRLLGKQFAGR